jgi:hypothetical protein
MRRACAWNDCALLLVRAALPLAMLLVVGCAGNESVARVVDGHLIEGRFIAPYAYEAFLRGALAEAEGDFRGALAAYEATEAIDPDDAEVSRRIARMQSRLDSHAPPPLDEPATTEVLVAGTSELPETERRRIEAVTLLHGDRIPAWEALAAWGMAHGDVALAVRGMMGVAARAPGRRLALAQSAVELAGRGYTAEARQLAGALLDVDGADGGVGVSVAAIPLVARLALDDALLRRDASRVDARSVRAHVGMEVAAARAWISGDGRLARELLAATVKADPSNLAARLVSEGAAGRARSQLLTSSAEADGPLAPEVALPFARDVLQAEGNVAASRVLSFGGNTVVPSGDARLTPLAVELTISGVLAEERLPADARVELAARRLVLPNANDVAAGALDERHALLGLALLRPTDSVTREHAARLAGAAAEDPLVAVSLAKIALARGEPVSKELRAALDALAPADPIVAAVVLDLAKHAGPPAALVHARQRLAALAKTPAERALSAE